MWIIQTNKSPRNRIKIIIIIIIPTNPTCSSELLSNKKSTKTKFKFHPQRSSCDSNKAKIKTSWKFMLLFWKKQTLWTSLACIYSTPETQLHSSNSCIVLTPPTAVKHCRNIYRFVFGIVLLGNLCSRWDFIYRREMCRNLKKETPEEVLNVWMYNNKMSLWNRQLHITGTKEKQLSIISKHQL